jgi:hypothetical protein
MAGYIGKSQGVTQVDGYTASEADSEFVNDPNGALNISSSASADSATIDASGNLLVGQSTSNFGAKGIRLRGDVGQLTATRDGGAPIGLNRLTSDGAILNFDKDGTTVGSIGTESGKPYFSNGGNFAIRLDNNALLPANPNGTASNNAENLGSASARWYDLYLGGGVYLGGTGSANYLDDYEEGTWTPAFGDILGNYVASYDYRYGYYTKIGRLVHVWGAIGINTYGGSMTSEPSIFGQPFTLSGTTSYTHPQGEVMFWVQPNAHNWSLNGETSRLFFRREGTTGDTSPSAASFGSGTKLSFSMTYHTS